MNDTRWKIIASHHKFRNEAASIVAHNNENTSHDSNLMQIESLQSADTCLFESYLSTIIYHNLRTIRNIILITVKTNKHSCYSRETILQCNQTSSFKNIQLQQMKLINDKSQGNNSCEESNHYISVSLTFNYFHLQSHTISGF